MSSTLNYLPSDCPLLTLTRWPKPPASKTSIGYYTRQ